MNRCAVAAALQLIMTGLLFFPGGAKAQLIREPNTTLQIPAAPPSGFTSINALGSLTFVNPVCIATPPNETNRLFVVEKSGRIIAITNLAAPTKTVFMDIADRVAASDSITDERGLLGLAFHPGYATNGYFFVFYTGDDSTAAGDGMHDILSRFSTSPVDPNVGLSGSEVRLIRQRDAASNHNGGDLHFGSDGYLYVSLGDEGGSNDSADNSQNITKDFFSAILRIDVDNRQSSLPPNAHPASTTNYAVPPDNPFVGVTSFNGASVDPAQVRTEFWTVGMRNPWRMSFDSETGDLYVGDVGQSAREEIDLIVKGGNYGWAYREGMLDGPKAGDAPSGFVSISPLIDYGRSEGFAVTGGVVYRGERYSQLYGAYLYGDYGSGRIWALRHDGNSVLSNTLLMTDDLNSISASGLSAFGIDPSNGDILYADVQNGSAADGKIKRIVSNGETNGPSLPPTLAETGAFSNVQTLTARAGIVPYDINVPFWSDNAIKSRWFSVPDPNLTIDFKRDMNWLFPEGSVWIKHFELELTNGVPSSRKRIETRFIVKHESGVYGITYRWGDSLTNAELVPEEGMDETFVINDGGGILRTQVWHYPSRSECLRCHTGVGGYALGFNTAQLNRTYQYGGLTTNQLAALSDAGYFSEPVTNRHPLYALARADDASVSLNYRVRSYLAANCAQCHQPDGSAQGAMWDAWLYTPTSQAGLINGALQANGGDPNNRVVVPGDLNHSVLLARINTLGADRMPPIDSNVIDSQAVGLVRAWITNGLSGYQTFEAFQLRYFGSTSVAEAAPDADPDLDFASNTNEWLTGTIPTNSASFWNTAISLANGKVAIQFEQTANRGFEVQHSTNRSAQFNWQPVDVSANAPFFSATNRLWSVETPIGDSLEIYRVRIFEP